MLRELSLKVNLHHVMCFHLMPPVTHPSRSKSELCDICVMNVLKFQSRNFLHFVYEIFSCILYCNIIVLFRFTAMAKTRELLRDGKYVECLALVRAARFVNLQYV